VCGKIFCDQCSKGRKRVEGEKVRVCWWCEREPEGPPRLPAVAGNIAESTDRLLVRLWGCDGVPRMDLLDESDVFVVLRAYNAAGERVGKEVSWPVVWNANAPRWNTVRDVGVTAREASVLQIRLWDKDLVGEDDYIGEAQVPLTGLRPGELRDVPVRCACTSGPTKCKVTLGALAPPPVQKTVFIVRHGQSRWNAGKEQGKMGRLQNMTEVDHPLSTLGKSQAEALCAKLEAAVLQGSSDVAAATTVIASPLTRATQTALIATGPIIRRTGKPLWLTRWAREKRNAGGRDTTGVAVGSKEVEARIRKETEKVYGSDKAGAQKVLRQELECSEINSKWWDDSAESKTDFAARIEELLGVIRYSPDSTLVLVGHSHCFRALCNYAVDPHAELIGLTLPEMQQRKLVNCGVMRCSFDFRRDKPLTRAELVFGTTMVGKWTGAAGAEGEEDDESEGEEG